ncbi:interleukin-11 receptor subunit alpha-like isoform X2 [Silurus meridionalis]|uniref:interleukin-11 receptor subunit alpha-like isoform X2 n=1 Tax=Silurus meridionalis TaxID=175797 RepID=UPI001EE9FF0A|nr:interleukin-11 receptor subunit alpha-like isoform X2 [Silurus meridionalis]
MSLKTALTLLILFAAKVHCGQENPACPRKESNTGALALNVGSEVILGCRGDVTVDSMSLIMRRKHNKRLERRGDATSHWKAQKGSPVIMGIHNAETPNSASTGKYKLNTVTGIYAKGSESVSTANPAKNSKAQMGSGQILQAVNQTIKLNRAFSVIVEMGLSIKKNTGTEYVEEDKDYDESMKKSKVTRSIKRRAQWTLNGKLMQDGVEHGGALRLPALQLTDSGNYSCYRKSKLVSSIRIEVGIPPKSPTLSCYKKSHISNIWCEWISKQPIIPQPQCYLLLRKGLEKITHVNCSYSAARSCCWCVLPSMENDRNVYTAKLCVTNTAGNATSSPFNYITQNIIKPDPPDEVKVMSVMGEHNMLNVTWSLPATWMWEQYYTLQFQLRYRPLRAREYQNVETGRRDWLILDALPYTNYEIQIRAKDEYEGQWSEWTSPVHAHTWTASGTTVAPVINTSLDTIWTFPVGHEESENEVDIRPAADRDAALWVYVLSVVGICLLITIVTLSVYFLRYTFYHII